MFSDMSKEQMLERAKFCLERVELSHALDLYPSEISGGMQKRAAIARAIVLNPKYLFCDEPNSGLDPKTSLLIDRLIQDITHEFNMTTIINTHDMNSVMEIGENICFIYKGEKAWQGSKEQIFDTGCEPLEQFVFASNLFKEVRRAHFLK
jgi:phospholipid/cholesterol/gamma-HCH transport system ATP-binding protein